MCVNSSSPWLPNSFVKFLRYIAYCFTRYPHAALIHAESESTFFISRFVRINITYIVFHTTNANKTWIYSHVFQTMREKRLHMRRNNNLSKMKLGPSCRPRTPVHALRKRIKRVYAIESIRRCARWHLKQKAHLSKRNLGSFFKYS